MIFFFHHYELPALLDQIRHQQQQQQQMPPHQHHQAANGGQPAPDGHAHLDEDSDQSGSDRSVTTEAEEQRVSDVVYLGTADADSASNQLSSVDHTELGLLANVAEHTVHVSDNVGGIYDSSSRQSAVSTSPMSVSTTDEVIGCHFSAVHSEETHVQSDIMLLPSRNVAVNAADVGRLLSEAVGGSSELRRRGQGSSSSSPCSSHEAFPNHQDGQELCTNLPSDGPVITDGSLADLSQNGNNAVSQSIRH